MNPAAPARYSRWRRNGGHGRYPPQIRELAPTFEGPILYVRAGAEAPGGGTRAAPLPSIDAALEREPEAGTIVALATGEYAEHVVVRSALALVGACVEGTVVRFVATEPAEPGVVRGTVALTEQAGARLANLTVTGNVGGVVAVATLAPIQLDSVRIQRVRFIGVGFGPATGGSLRQVVVRGTAHESDGTLGGAMAVDGASDVTLDDVVLEHNGGPGVFVRAPHGGATPSVTATDLVVRGSRQEVVGEAREREPSAVAVQGAGRLEITRALMADCDYGAWAGGGQGAAELALTDVVVDGTSGSLIEADEGAVVRVERGLFVSGDGVLGAAPPDRVPPRLALSDVVVLDTAFEGLQGYGGAAISAERVLIRGAHVAGVSLLGTFDAAMRPVPGLAATADLRDVVVLDTGGTAAFPEGVGVLVAGGASLVATRLLVQGSTGAGVLARSPLPDAAAELTAEDLVVEETLPFPSGGGGVGLLLQDNVQAEVTRTRLRGNHTAGVSVANPGAMTPGPVVTLHDLTASDTRSVRGQVGSGLVVTAASEVSVRRALLERNTQVGAFVFNEVAYLAPVQVELEDLAIRDTQALPCSGIPEGEPGSCVEGGRDRGVGQGLVVRAREHVGVRRFSITGQVGAGLQLGPAGGIEAAEGVITGNGIGVVIYNPDFDMQALSDGVFVFGNTTDASREGVEVATPESALPELVGEDHAREARSN